MSRSHDNWDLLNNVFGNLDAAFRELEKENGWFNRLPFITLPSVKTQYVDRRTYHDGEKTIKMVNGMRHCEDGPAIIYDDGRPDEFWLEGVKVTKEEVESNMQKIMDEKIHQIHIDGRTFEVTGKQLREMELIEKLKDIQASD